MIGSPATDIDSDIDETERQVPENESRECTLVASGIDTILCPQPAALAIVKTPSLAVLSASASWITDSKITGFQFSLHIIYYHALALQRCSKSNCKRGKTSLILRQ